MHHQDHHCWWPDDARIQGGSQYRDFILPVYDPHVKNKSFDHPILTWESSYLERLSLYWARAQNVRKQDIDIVCPEHSGFGTGWFETNAWWSHWMKMTERSRNICVSIDRSVCYSSNRVCFCKILNNITDYIIQCCHYKEKMLIKTPYFYNDNLYTDIMKYWNGTYFNDKEVTQ